MMRSQFFFFLALIRLHQIVSQKPGVNSKRQAKRQTKKKRVFILNSEFRILSERLMTIDGKNTEMAAISDFSDSRGGS